MSLKKNIVANYLGQAWTALMGLAFVPVYIQQLGMEAYGIVGLYTLLQAGLVLLDMGISQTLNREMARYTAGQYTEREIQIFLRSVEIVGAGAALFFGSAIFLGAQGIAGYWVRAQHLPIPEIQTAISTMGLIVALRVMEGLYRGGIAGLQQQIVLNMVGAGVATGRWAGAACIVLWVQPSITAFFIWHACISAIAVMAYRHILYRPLPTTEKKIGFSIHALKKVQRFTGGMLATTALALVLTQSDKLLLSRILSLEAFGYYTLATLVSSALNLAGGPVTQALYPRFTELITQKNTVHLARSYHLGAQLMSVVTMPLALLLIFFGQDLITAWTGNSSLATQVAPILAPLAIGTMLNGLMGMPYILQLAHGWTGFAARMNMVAVAILVPLIIWITPHYGAIGAAWVWVALNTGYIFLGVHFMHQRLLPQEKWRWYWQDIAIPGIPIFVVIFISHTVHPTALGRVGEWCWLIGSALLALIFGSLFSRGIREKLNIIYHKYS